MIVLACFYNCRYNNLIILSIGKIHLCLKVENFDTFNTVAHIEYLRLLQRRCSRISSFNKSLHSTE